MVQDVFMKENKKKGRHFYFIFVGIYYFAFGILLFINFVNGTIFLFIYLSNLSKEKHVVTQTWVINF